MVGVIVISAIFGVDDDTQRICDRLADAGYPAMALNMFWHDDTDAGPLSGAEHEKAKALAFSCSAPDKGPASVSSCQNILSAIAGYPASANLSQIL